MFVQVADLAGQLELREDEGILRLDIGKGNDLDCRLVLRELVLGNV